MFKLKLPRKVLMSLGFLASTGLCADAEPHKLRAEQHPWEKSIRGFRREHQLAFLIGHSFDLWTIKRAGKTLESRAFGPMIKGHYSFHLPLGKKFGYYLGTSTGLKPPFWRGPNESLSPGYGVLLPGFVMGFAWNLSPTFRLNVGAEAQFWRFERFVLNVPDDSKPRETIGFNAKAFSLHVALDHFFLIDRGIRWEWAYQSSRITRPKDYEDFAISADVRQRSVYLQLGALMHLL